MRVRPLPTPETGNGSSMGPSVASSKALGSRFKPLVGTRAARSVRKKKKAVKNTDVLCRPFETMALWWASQGCIGLLIVSAEGQMMGRSASRDLYQA